ncbi:MAG: hypothetical protein LBI60_06230 [Bacteroidales bacterium]|jgi:hypothetical protein|nr:hypothetical protein [Bacteroidales bacterium]
MEDEIISKKTELEIERAELNLLIQSGFRFHVSIGKKKKTFEIHEPTLNVLDQISAISLEMVLNKDEFQANAEILTNARKLVKGNAKRQAAIIAIAVTGESYYTNIPIFKTILNVLYHIKLRKLTNLFLHTITPSQLIGLSDVITNISNLGDFVSSMRLLSDARTTEPIKDRIELPD